jgi:hypothetical protein
MTVVDQDQTPLHLRNGDTPGPAGHRIRHRRYDGVALHPRSRGPARVHRTDPDAGDAGIARLAYAILDGTVVRTDRLSGTGDRRYYAGKHRHHGVNIQVIADCAGRLIWRSPALPGSAHDLTAAREHGIIDMLAEARVMTFCGQGLSGCWLQRAHAIQAAPPAAAVVPQPKGRQRAHAMIRGIGERAIATRKHWSC